MEEYHLVDQTGKPPLDGLQLQDDSPNSMSRNWIPLLNTVSLKTPKVVYRGLCLRLHHGPRSDYTLTLSGLRKVAHASDKNDVKLSKEKDCIGCYVLFHSYYQFHINSTITDRISNLHT